MSQQQATLMRATPVVASATIGTLFVMFGQISPTGTSGADIFWTAAFGMLLGLAVPRSPAWVLLLASGVAAPFTQPNLSGMALVSVIVVSLLLASRGWAAQLDSAAPWSNVLATVCAAGMTAALLGLHDRNVPFLSATTATLVTTLLCSAAWAAQARPTRKRVLIAAISAVFLLVGIAALAMRPLDHAVDSVSRAESALVASLDAARDGDAERASASMREATHALTEAQNRLNALPVKALAHVPVSAQNIGLARRTIQPTAEVLTSSQRLISSSSTSTSFVSADSLDPERIAVVAESFDEVLLAVDRLAERLRSEDNVWVLRPIRQRIESATSRTESATRIVEAGSVATVVEQILGVEEPRTYLVLFGNPAEARELGGFAGGTALIEISRGSVQVLRTDRPSILNDSPSSPNVFSNVQPQRFLEHRPWLYSQNFTAMADFPTLARSLGDLYPTMGGSSIDGVLYLDPRAFAALLAITGPLELDASDVQVSAENVSRLLTVDQYDRYHDRDEREAFLEELISSTFDALQQAGFEPRLSDLDPLVKAIQQDRLLFAPLDHDEFLVMAALGITGGLPALEANDYLAVSHLNGGPNKLDAYLHREVHYEATIDENGELEATLTIRLENRAPANLTRYAAGNSHGLPPGTNRLTLVVHTPHDSLGWTGGDEPELTRSWHEFGRQRHERVVVVPPGEVREVSVALRGHYVADDYHLDIGHQPLVTNDDFVVQVNDAEQTFVLFSDRTVSLDIGAGD